MKSLQTQKYSTLITNVLTQLDSASPMNKILAIHDLVIKMNKYKRALIKIYASGEGLHKKETLKIVIKTLKIKDKN